MAKVTNFIETISSFIKNKLSRPLATIPSIMLICSTVKRSGMSSLQTSAKILNRLDEKKINIGLNIDGSQNLFNQAVFILVDEIFKTIKLDGKVSIGVPAGAITSQGVSTGGNVIVTNTTNNVFNGLME